MQRLSAEIRAEHARNRIAREAQSTLIDTLHADRLRMEQAIAQAAQSVSVPAASVDTSTTTEHMATLQANLQPSASRRGSRPWRRQ
jgi:hypothetical protein